MNDKPILERIADTIEPSLWEGSQRSDAIYLAKAVLTAIRTPTKSMIDAADALTESMASGGYYSETPAQPADAWRAMIDEALAEE